jgi:Na+/H+-dicarboxylate symporter
VGAGAGKRASRIVTVGGPLGLIAGVALGWLAQSGNAPWLMDAVPFIRPVGQVWMNALSVAVVPLTVTLLVTGVCALPRSRGTGRLAAATFGWYLALLLVGALVGLIATRVYLAANPLPPLSVPGVDVQEPEALQASWADALVPSNLFAAAGSGNILPLAVVAVLFGAALRSLPQDRRAPVEALFAGVRDAVLVFVRCVMYAVPVGAFCLVFAATVESGLAAAGVMVQFVLFISAVLAVAALFVCVAIIVAAKQGVAKGIGALAPLLAVAVGTRSSLASLPALIESADELGLPKSASEIVLPTSVSLFKMNRTISATAKVLFMAAAIGVVVSPGALVVFIGTVVLLSFATPGLPAGGGSITWGAYVAAGVPLEVVVLFEPVDAPTDFSKTALNVVADLAVAVFVSRRLTQTQSEPSLTPLGASEEPAY